MTVHAPTVAEVEAVIEQLVRSDEVDLGATEAVVGAVVDQLSHKLYSDRSRSLTRGAVLIVLQRLDLLAGADPSSRLTAPGDEGLVEETLRNADEYDHEHRDRLEGR